MQVFLTILLIGGALAIIVYNAMKIAQIAKARKERKNAPKLESLESLEEDKGKEEKPKK